MSPDPIHRRPGRRRRAPMAYTGTPQADASPPPPPAAPAPEPASAPPRVRRTVDGLQDLKELMELSELSCPPESLPSVLRYLTRMLEENQKINLSGIRELHEAFALHVVDSLFVWQAVAKAPRVILDIGSGNGFPGVAAACLWPKARVILVERRQKKANAIATCAKDVGIKNVEIMAVDAGQLSGLDPALRRGCDLVLSRATASLAEIAKLAAPLLRSEGLLVQWKALQFSEEERRDYERQQKRLHLQSREDLLYVIQAEEPRPRRLVSALKL